MVLKLKTQRQLLAACVAVLLPVTGALALAAADDGPDRVALGGGLAGVDPSLVEVDPALLDTPYIAGDDTLDSIVEEIGEGVDEAVDFASDVAEELGIGEASYYGPGFAGRPTASGEIFDPAQMTAAHRTLPMGSRVRVTHVASGRSLVVRINDRGPFHGNRVIDLSEAAARQLGMLAAGRAQVKLTLLTD